MMKKVLLIFLSYVALSCIGNILAHPGHVHEEEKKNMIFSGRISEVDTVMFHLFLPYKSMFRDEKPWLVYGIKNTGSDDIILTNHVVGKDVNYGHVHDAQMWFQFRKGNEVKWNLHPAYGRNWSRMTGDQEFVQVLRGGEIIAVSSRDGASFSNSTAMGFNNVRAALFIDDDQYVASNWCEIMVSDKSLMDDAEIIEIDYGSPTYKAPLYISELDGERWIFIQDYRISKVPDETQPIFSIDKETSIMTIRFNGGDYEPIIHDVRMIRTLSGPRKLIPHFYAVKNMEAELTALSAHALPDSPDLNTQLDQTFRPLSKTEEPSKTGSEPASKSTDVTTTEAQPLRVWFWIIATLLAIAGITAVIRRI